MRRVLDDAAFHLNIRLTQALSHSSRANLLMMMAYDSSPGPNTLAEETIAAVRSALVPYIGAPADGTRLRDALRAMADEARAKSMPAEQLLIVLKDVWYSLPDVRAMRDGTQQVRLLQRIVTMCIKEYYSQAD